MDSDPFGVIRSAAAGAQALLFGANRRSEAAESRVRELERERDALKAEVAQLRGDLDRWRSANGTEQAALAARLLARAIATEAELARLKQPGPDNRRVPGAVVLTSSGTKFIVLNSDDTRCQQMLGYPHGVRENFLASDTFVHWATPAECERHGIPYVDRAQAGIDAPANELADALKEYRRACSRWHESDAGSEEEAIATDSRNEWAARVARAKGVAGA